MPGARSHPFSRRRLLAGLSSIVGLGSLRSEPFEDRDGDGVPDHAERSETQRSYIEETFELEEFDGFDPTRRDLLIDARYVGNASVSDRTKAFLERTFRDRGIHLQWLDYPHRYDAEAFAENYGDQVERVLWPFESFYTEEVEEELRNIALQVIILPGEQDLESLYTLHQGEDFHGVSFGNRCLVTAQSSIESEATLIMHEIGHLVLCHTDDPASVMSATPSQLTFTDAEWERLRSNLDNVRDATGYDVVFRSCLFEEYTDNLEIDLEDAPIE